MRKFDLILESGSYWIDCPCATPPTSWHNEVVAQIMVLRAWHRLPGLGKLWRNAWAKRHGAALERIHHGGRE